MTRCCESCAGKLERPTDDRKSAGPYIVTQEGGRIFLTDEGIDVSNIVLAEFLLDEKEII